MIMLGARLPGVDVRCADKAVLMLGQLMSGLAGHGGPSAPVYL